MKWKSFWWVPPSCAGLLLIVAALTLSWLVYCPSHSTQDASHPVLRDKDGDVTHIWVTIKYVKFCINKSKTYTIATDPKGAYVLIWGFCGEPGESLYMPVYLLREYSPDHLHHSPATSHPNNKEFY